MSLPFPDFTPSTTISSSEVDQNNDDIADEITNSLPRDGQAGMTAQLKLSDGTVATPGLGFSLDPNTGIYRIGTDNIGVAAAGAKVLDIATTGLAVTGTLSSTGDLTVSAGFSVAQDVIFSGDITPAQISANTDDYAPTGHATAYVFRLSTDASRNLTGIQGGVDGRKILILNVGSFDLVLKDDVTSTEANRFQLSGDLTLAANTGVELQYDDTSDRWRPTSPQVNSATIGVGKQSIWMPAGSMIPRSDNGAFLSVGETTTNKVTRQSLDYDATTQQFAQFQIAAPKSWNESTITFKAYWTHPATTVNFGVVWELQGLALSNDDALDTAFGTAVEVADTGGTTDDVYITSESTAVTIGGTPAESDYLIFQIARDPANGSDTMVVDAYLLGVMVFFTTNANTDD